MARCYVRNGVWGWSIQEQLDALEAAGVLEPDRLYKDELPPAQAKKPALVRPEWLVQRNDGLLRSSGRHGSEDIAVATLTALAPNQRDLADALTKAATRKAFVRACDSGFLFGPKDGPDSLVLAMDDWQRAKDRARTKPGRTAGYLAAAEKKLADTERKLKIARPLWRNPDGYTAAEIEVLSGLSWKTIHGRLGRRPAKKKGKSRVKN